jgi:mono/diheme cytochrome c family protein
VIGQCLVLFADEPSVLLASFIRAFDTRSFVTRSYVTRSFVNRASVPFVAAVLWMLVAAPSAESAPPSLSQRLERIRPFLRRHCQECHGPDRQANDLRFDNLSGDLTQPDNLTAWQEIVDQLNLGTMPPKNQPRPDPAELASVIGTLTDELKAAYARLESTGGKTVLRRLNRFELRNTLRDLLYLDGAADFRPDVMVKLEDRNGDGVARWTSEDPTREFPADELDDGFDTIGKRLVMSDFLLRKAISAAEYSLDLATQHGPRPNLEPRTFTSPIRTDGPHGDLQQFAREALPDCDCLFQRYREPGAASGGLGRIAPTAIAQTGVAVRGRYRISVEASAHHQRHPWQSLIKSRPDETMLLGLHMIDSRLGALSDDNPKSIKLTEWEVPADGQRRVFSLEALIDARWLPWLGWENAPYDRGLTPSKLVQAFLPEAYQALSRDASEVVRRQYEPSMAKKLFAAGYAGPHLRIYRLSIELIDTAWPPRSHTALYGATGTEPTAELLRAFSRRAFRRSVTNDEISPYVALVDSRLKERGDRPVGEVRTEALRAGYTAMLASPRFYYLAESDGPLDSYALASRLSYFLWSSIPDEELLTAAADGSLREPIVLRRQVDRMLDDPRSAAFIRRFTTRWLRLYKLGTMPPPGGFYYHRQMEGEMLKQTDAFFAYLVRTNGRVRDIVDSDYTFLNERVAQWIYQRDDVWGDGFRRVAARPPHGGGMLTMPAIMTATANGVDTSPVVRGVWLLESILGTPPAPPPPDVEPLSPDLRGAKSIRDQLAAHRAQESCAACHRRIDPFGFPFENFDELGLWRTRYRDGGGSGGSEKLSINASAELPDGTQVDDIAGLKRALTALEPRIVHHLAESLLVYASGRRMEISDRAEIDRVVDDIAADGNRLRDLIQRVVASRIFREK